MSILKRGALASTPPLLGWKKERVKMDLKMRPMSEAPFGKKIIIVRNDGITGCYVKGQGVLTGDDWVGFYEISDLLRAAEILAAITPEGFQYDSHEDSTKWPSYLHCQRVVNFRRIAPPVEYEYVASDKPRMQMLGDYELLSDGKFHLADLHPPTEGIYFRRVEVKR